MKYLKIDDNKGYFLRENAWVPIDQIIKEDIFELISLAVLPKDGTTFEMDDNMEFIKLFTRVFMINYLN